MHRHRCILFVLAMFFTSAAFTTFAQTTLNLNEVFRRIESENPSLKALRSRTEEATGRKLQAGVRKNPIIGIEFAKFAGNKEFAGTSKLENSIKVSQEILTAGKRQKRVAAADISRQIADTNLATERLQLFLSAGRKFLSVLRLQAMVAFAEENQRISVENAGAVTKKVAAGEVPEIDGTRAMVEAAMNRTAVQKLKRELEAVKYELASLWNESGSNFTLNDSCLEFCDIGEFSKEECLELMVNHPELHRAELNCLLAEAEIRLVRAEKTGNIEIEGGISREKDGNRHHYFVGLAVPINVFDRQHGNLKAAKSSYEAAQAEKRQIVLQLKTKIGELFQQAASVAEEYENAANTLLPTAKEAFKQMQKAYNAGERELFELFDARRMLLEAEIQTTSLKFERQEKILEICLMIDCSRHFSEPPTTEPERKN